MYIGVRGFKPCETDFTDCTAGSGPHGMCDL